MCVCDPWKNQIVNFHGRSVKEIYTLNELTWKFIACAHIKNRNLEARVCSACIELKSYQRKL